MHWPLPSRRCSPAPSFISICSAAEWFYRCMFDGKLSLRPGGTLESWIWATTNPRRAGKIQGEPETGWKPILHCTVASWLGVLRTRATEYLFLHVARPAGNQCSIDFQPVFC